MKQIDILQFIRKDIKDIEEYVPGESAIDLARRYGVSVGKLIKLNANENPYGPSPFVKKSIAKIPINYYPPSNYIKLKEALAKYTATDVSQIVVGSGSDEIIDLLLRIVLEKGEKVVTCPPTFGMYEILTKINQGTIINVPRRSDYEIDIKLLLKQINDSTKIIFLCNPNNPTGNLTPISDIEKLLETEKLIVIDEAYYEFSKITTLPLLKKYLNLIVLRTLSKWAGLAGLRIGYAIMNPFLASEIIKIKPPFNVNSVAQQAAIATLNDLSFAKKTIEKIIEERKKMFQKLQRMTNIQVYWSYGNFLFVQVKNKKTYEKLKSEFEKRKIALRYYQSPSLNNGIRITIGKPEQNRKVISVFKEAVL